MALPARHPTDVDKSLAFPDRTTLEDQLHDRRRPWHARLESLHQGWSPSDDHLAPLPLRRRHEARLGEPDRRIASAVRFVDTHYASSLVSETRLARHVALSVSHFGRLFRERLGFSFRHYLKRVRVRRALVLIRTTDLTLFSIAQCVGYSHASTFSRDFRLLIGVAPTVYRQAHGATELSHCRPRRVSGPGSIGEHRQ